jgi:tetratricopeptide (TPR) repeat protein
MMTARLVWPAVVVIALLTLVVSKLPNEARAQGPDELASLRAQVSQLFSQGKYAEAVPIAEQYVALARQKYGDNHAEYAAAISWLANVYQAQGRYAEAEPLYKRALAIHEKALGPDHPDVGTALNNLAELYRAQGRYPEAEPLHKRALAIPRTSGATASIDGHRCTYDRAVMVRLNIKVASELPHPGDHPWDANCQPKRLPVLASRGFLSSLSVIADDQTQPLAHKSEIDGDARRGGAAIHVGQCLLNNAEQRLLKLERELVDPAA